MSTSGGARRVPTQERSQQRVAQIMAAAIVLLREGGIPRCTMAELANEAGLTPPSIYRYFPDAASVIRAVAEETLEATHQVLALHLEGVDSEAAARKALRDALRAFHRAFVEDRVLRELWAGTFATPDLVALNIADSRRNGEFIAARIGPFSPLDRVTLRTRTFLLAHLTGASMSLLLETGPSEAKRIFVQVERIIDLLFEPT
jgi:AcrR family transcriptional regulator